MSKVIRYMPELQDDEQVYVAQLMSEMTEEQAEHFASVLRKRRKDETVTLITGLVFLIGFAGVNRFYLDQVGMGLLYLFTWGLCGIGAIVDLFRYKTLTAQYNMKQADSAARMIFDAFPETRQLSDTASPGTVENAPPSTPEE